MNFITSKKARARITLSVLGAALGVLLFSVSLFAQANFGRIIGTVTDQSGGVLAGATVTIIDKDRGVARTLTTDDAGEYNAPTLIPGNYTVRVEAKGFRKLERQNVVLEVGKEVRVDLTPQPGEQQQTVTVTEQLPLVETTNATLGGTLNNADINDMPLNGRNYQYLLNLRPGVMIQPGGGPWTQSTNNIRPDESGWMVDGVLNANFYDARPVTGASSFITDGATILPVDGIQEFNLEENPKAEYGWKPGAVVNVGIRSGTNNLHGTAYDYYRSQAWGARNYFNPGPTNGTCVLNPTLPATCNSLPLQLKQFGGTVGGPIKKDKLFFFAGYEGLRDLIGNAFPSSVPATGSLANDGSCKNGGTGRCSTSMVDAINELIRNSVPVSPVSLAVLGCPAPPSPAGTLYPTGTTCTGGLIQGASATSTGYLSTFPNINNSDNGVAKVDYRINSKHMIDGMMWIGNYGAIGEDHPIINANWLNTAQIRNWTVVGNWIWTPSSRVVNELRFGLTRSTSIVLPADRNVFANGSAPYFLNTGITSYGGFPQVRITGFLGRLGSWNGRPMEIGPSPFYDVQDSVSYLLGKHSLKFGFEFARIEADSFNHDTRGRIDFQGRRQFCPPGVSPGKKGCTSTPVEDLFAAKPSRGFQLIGNARRKMIWRDYAGFIQDDWRLTPKLIVNLGLRYSYTSPIKEDNNLFGNFDPLRGLVQQGQASVGDTLWKPDYKDFSPRLGFAWDVTGKGTTVVRAGASIIYSSFVAASFVGQGATNFPGGSLGAIPTGANIVVNGVTTPGSGTIDLGTVNYTGGQLSWNGVVFPGGAVSCKDTKPCNIAVVDPHLHTPYITNWNLSVTRAFNTNLSLEVGYVGNHGTRLNGITDINQCPPNTTGCVRPFDTKLDAAGNTMNYLNFINLYSNPSFSNYHSLQATLTERVTHGLSFTSGYTYGHGLDNNSENRLGPIPQDSTNPRAEYASGDFDVRHRFTFTASYQLPGKKGFGQLLEGWKLNSIVSVQTAQPWNIGDTGSDFSATGESADRWNFFGNPADFKSGAFTLPYCSGFGVIKDINGNITGIDTSGVSCSKQSGIYGTVTSLPATIAAPCTSQAVNPDPTNLAAGGCYVVGNSVMVPPKAGTFGTMGRNIFRDNGFRNWDFSVFKNFSFKERYGAQFRVELFNLLNHPTISNPNGGNNGGHTGDDPSNASTFGCGCGTPDFVTGNPFIGSGSSRQLQLGLKLTF